MDFVPTHFIAMSPTENKNHNRIIIVMKDGSTPAAPIFVDEEGYRYNYDDYHSYIAIDEMVEKIEQYNKEAQD